MLTKLAATYRENIQGFNFILKMVLVYAFFAAIYEWVLSPYTNIDHSLINIIINQSEWLLEQLGYDLLNNSSNTDHLMGIKGSSGVIIGGPCDGLSLFILYSTFIISFKGAWWSKSISIILGVGLIHCLNVLRVMALALIVVYAPDQLDFHHSYTFTLFIYGIVFGMWMIRIKVYQWTKK
jgi:exosortase family protein XrtF